MAAPEVDANPNGEGTAVKRSLIWGLALLLSLSVVPMAGAQEIIELNFWHALGGSKQPGTDWLIEQFEAEYPHIKVVSSNISNVNELDERLIVSVLAGQPPDVVSNHFYFVAKYAFNGIVEDLGPYMARDGISADMFLPSVFGQGAYNGTQYALPIYSDSRILYYNKDFYAESGLDPDVPPATWDDFRRYSGQLVRFDGDTMSRSAWDVNRNNTNMFLPLLWGWGGEFFNEDGTAAFHGPAGTDAWSFWDDLYNNSRFVPEEGGPNLRMRDGTSAMTFNNPAAIVTMLDELLDYEWAVARLPAGPAGQYSWADSFQMWIPTGAAQTDAAWKFIEFAMRRESQIMYNALTWRIPPRLDALRNNPELHSEYMIPFVDAMQFDSVPIPGSPIYTDIWNLALNPQLQNAMHRRAPVQTALESAARLVDQYLVELHAE